MTKPLSPASLGVLPEWDLSALYPAMDAPAVTLDLERALREAESFAKAHKGTLAALAEHPHGAEKLVNLLRGYEALQDLLGRLMSYASLLHAGDTLDSRRAKFYGDVVEKVTAASTALLFFELELNQIADDAFEALIAHAALDHYRPWLVNLRREKPYQLEDRVETLFHEKALTGASAWNRLFDETITGLRFHVEGEALGLEATLHLLQEESADKRRAAAEALSKTFSENIKVFTLITNVLAKDKEISDRWRGFKDIADARHLANHVEGPVVEALVSAVRAAYPTLSHRYYRLKAKWMGKDKLDHWDRNAPLPGAITRTIPWERARETVLGAYHRFAPKMAEIARRFFDERWIDAALRPGKAPGAFSHPTVPSAHPFVLVNYQGRIRDVMTLAHELGHGVHQVLAARQGPLLAPTPLTLAETASVFGEMLTFKALLAEAGSKNERRLMLASKVEDMLNTVVRQIAFYTFEREIHTARRAGELTPEAIGALWLKVQGESLGPEIILHPGYEVFWAYIPHFIHAPFYVYAYAFGDCLVNSLYAVFEEADSSFQDNYFALLEAGGSKHHRALLAPFGLDAGAPDFWQKGLGVIARMIDELESLESA